MESTLRRSQETDAAHSLADSLKTMSGLLRYMADELDREEMILREGHMRLGESYSVRIAETMATVMALADSSKMRTLVMRAARADEARLQGK